ncbi:MAG: hypothetical protein WDN44_11910 [Sphingomonas sp.]
MIALLLAVQDVGTRPTGIDVAASRSFEELQACVIAEMSEGGFVEPRAIEGGMAFDWFMPTPLGVKGKNILLVEVVDRDGVRHMTIKYRRPFSRKIAVKRMREVVAVCEPLMDVTAIQ